VAAIADAVPDATTDEAAAIAVVLGAHMTDQQRTAAAAAGDDQQPSWKGKQWQFAGRLEKTIRRGGVRIRADAPTNEWTAAGRADRL